MTFPEKRRAWLDALLLTAIAALVYLPNVSSFTFHRDDWYYMYDGLVYGAGVFLAMFENLRPLRGPLYEALFASFGTNPLPYHLLLFVWRVLGGIGMGWLIRLLWPRQSRVSFWGSVLFVVYPGFLWWVAGFEYQPMVLSVAAQIFSFAFTLKSVKSSSSFSRILWVSAAILTSWLTLGLVEYAIGMEVFRYLCVYLVINREEVKVTWRGAWRAMYLTLPSFLGPLLFLIWRQFFFENIRKAADVGLQIGRLFDSPLTLLTWVVRLFQGMADVIALAWTVPLRHYFFGGEVKEMSVGLAFALAAAILFVWFAARHRETTEDDRWKIEATLIGLLGALAGLLPIIVANRYISFDRFSHYTLPASIAAILFVIGLAGFVSERHVRATILGGLVLFAGLTHSAMSAQAAHEAEVINQFWWQVSWRAPSIQAGTTLVVIYPDVIYAEGSDIVWGPANFVYYPQSQSNLPILVPLPAARMESDLLTNVQTGQELKQVYIVVNFFHYRFDDILVVTQPVGSCVHVMDSRWPAIAPSEGGTLAELAGYSRVENILASGSDPILQEEIFGREPAREWCYYFQQADWARQQGDWKRVAALGMEAGQKGYIPSDPLEWIPFLQAGVFLGDDGMVKNLAEELKANPAFKADRDYYKEQFCESMRALDAAGYPLPIETANLAAGLFCR